MHKLPASARTIGIAVLISLMSSPLVACGGSAQSAPSADKPDLTAQLSSAMQSYHDYLASNADSLVSATKAFTDAIRAGDIAKAKRDYVIAHPFHEHLESVTDNFDELDKGVDQRPGEGTDPSSVTGFHRLEKALWGDKSVSGLMPVATKLDADVATLRGEIQKGKFTAEQVLKGGTTLLEEVGARNTSQDEDAFSHADLYDLAGNIDGVEKAFTLLAPAISARDAALADQIKQKFTAADGAVAKFKQGNTYPDFSTVGTADRQTIGNAVKDVAQTLSKASSVLA